MISTTFAAVALSAALTAGAATPTWQSDYAKALQTASAEQKPIAVFIGKGETGYTKVAGGQIPTDAGQLLAQNYVCVYVNTDTAAGKALAGKFDISKGLIISGKGGDVQALRYAGTVTPIELTGFLTKYSSAKAVTTTENAGTTDAPVVAGGCANGQCGSSAVSGGCANGQCSGTSRGGLLRRR